nr:MAG TPA: hypothetical protein [Caudoviricetes sp.]
MRCCWRDGAGQQDRAGARCTAPPLTSAAWRCSFPTALRNSTLQSRNKS